MFQEINREIEDILSRQLFFIAATEKSGTTWMQLMLDAHPEIACRGEGQFVSKLAGCLGGALNDYSSFIEGLNEKVFLKPMGFQLSIVTTCRICFECLRGCCYPNTILVKK